MNYRRTYWLLFLGAGLLFGLLNYLDYVETGQLTLLIAVSVLVAIVIVGVSAFAARYPDRVGGPDELGPRFALALGMFLLFLVLVFVRILEL